LFNDTFASAFVGEKTPTHRQIATKPAKTLAFRSAISPTLPFYIYRLEIIIFCGFQAYFPTTDKPAVAKPVLSS